MATGMWKGSKSLIRSLCAYLMRYIGTKCYTYHTSSHGAISIANIFKKSCALRVILTYLDIQRRLEHDVLSHEAKIFDKNSDF